MPRTMQDIVLWFFRLACAITCSKNGKCVSFNYCDRGMCHLKAMTINDDFVLSVVKRNEECVYAGRRDSCVRSDPSYEVIFFFKSTLSNSFCPMKKYDPVVYSVFKVA